MKLGYASAEDIAREYATPCGHHEDAYRLSTSNGGCVVCKVQAAINLARGK